MNILLSDLPRTSANRFPDRTALVFSKQRVTYASLLGEVEAIANGLFETGIARGDRVAFYLDKRIETVVAAFGIANLGAVFVPINPVLKSDQVLHILRDCNVKALITTPERCGAIREALDNAPDLKHLVIVGEAEAGLSAGRVASHAWTDLIQSSGRKQHRVIDSDMVAILYTSGSTGKPKGVVLSHKNMVSGAKSVASYLQNHSEDRILSALPLSFDAGFSQLTTGFHAGASVVLLNYLMPRDVLNAIESEEVTGLTAVPPLWIQLSQLEWKSSITEHLRYIANTGGRMPREVLDRLRAMLPRTKPFLMYGLTEAFRSTYLPPDEVDRRPDSIGKAIPNAEVLVVRPNGTECDPEEPGELVHRGALVSMGYWNDPDKTAERFKQLPVGLGGRESGMMLPEIAVFSGDTVKRDAEGFLYFVGRNDEMIKTSGYRVSPTEVEEALYKCQSLAEVAAFGAPHPSLGQVVIVIAYARDGNVIDANEALSEVRNYLPAYMIPSRIEIRREPLPRNPNGKIDRKLIATEYLKTYVAPAR